MSVDAINLDSVDVTFSEDVGSLGEKSVELLEGEALIEEIAKNHIRGGHSSHSLQGRVFLCGDDQNESSETESDTDNDQDGEWDGGFDIVERWDSERGKSSTGCELKESYRNSEGKTVFEGSISGFVDNKGNTSGEARVGTRW